VTLADRLERLPVVEQTRALVGLVCDQMRTVLTGIPSDSAVEVDAERPFREHSLDSLGLSIDAAEGRLGPEVFRRVLGHFCTGVTIITAVDGGQPVGFTCQSFAALSLQPPLVSFSVSCTSRSWPRIERSGVFCVNILSTEQEELCLRFARSCGYKFGGVRWRPGAVTGAPRLPASLAWVECALEAVHPGGDHLIAVGRVRDLAVADVAAEPLLFFLSAFRQPAPLSIPTTAGRPTPRMHRHTP
jgi:3-hydroxy-9,10-secoandrosta-1,3,5(10)-triene-9,17-dione monooxygenase reductase component